ncbi:MAG: ATP-binding cassette domain-containing protein [Pseudomonadota bacterium]
MTLHLQHFSVSLSGRTLGTLDAAVGAGDVLSVMGPSGVGKSSLLLGLAGLLEAPFAVTGRASLGGQDLLAQRPHARRLGLMFQDPLLFPHLDVVGNVMFAVPERDGDGRRMGRAVRRERAMAQLARVELGGLADRDPTTLSGGQKSRVALARTLAAEPKALLLDEPFAALDQALRAAVRAMVFGCAEEDALPVILVSHDPADAAAAGGPILTLSA